MTKYLIGVLVALALVALPAEASAEYTTSQIKSAAIARAKKIGVVTEEEKKSAKADSMNYATANAIMSGEEQSLQTQSEMSSEMQARMNSRVVKVVIEGKFTDWSAHTPRHAHAPTGTILEQVYDPQTEMRLSVRLWSGQREGWPNLSYPQGGEESGCPGCAGTARHHRYRPLGVKAHSSATWGGGCSRYSHCYSTSEWKMPCCSERVRGSESDIDTTTMVESGADLGAGSFVDNEKWDAFQQYENSLGPYWIETGQANGGKYPDGQMRWFVAMNRGLGYYANESPWVEALGTFNVYQTASQLDHQWCVYINGGNAGCYGGFPIYANDLEVGVEAATAYKPSNAMQEQSNATHTNGGLHTYPWNHGEPYADTGLCIGPYSRENPPNYFPGNIVAGTC